MAQAPTLPSITIPSAEYSTLTTWELKNTKQEGDGIELIFLFEDWPPVPLLFTIWGLVSVATGQPVYQAWFGPSNFSGTPDPRHPTYKIKTARWQGEPDGSGGRKPQKGDFKFDLNPTQTFRTTITARFI